MNIIRLIKSHDSYSITNIKKLSKYFAFLFSESCLICRNTLTCSNQATPLEPQIIIDPLFPTNSMICPYCQPQLTSRLHELAGRAPKGLNSLHSIWRMEGEVETLIKAYKYHSISALAKPFAISLSNLIEILPPRQWDLIVSIPSIPAIERQRRFAHIALICRELSKRLSVPFNNSVLYSMKGIKRQVETPIAERAKNAEHKYYTHGKNLGGKRILLVDDTITSGASLSAAARSLLYSGARSIDGITLARSRFFQPK